MGVHAPTTIALFTLIAVALSCTSEVPSEVTPDAGGGDSEIETLLRAHFNRDVLPTMEAAFCEGCHTNPDTAPPFLTTDTEHPTIYDQVIAWNQGMPAPLVDLETPSDSLLLTKGPHQGTRWWTDAERQTIAPWIDAEADFARLQDQVATEALEIPYGEVVIDLEEAGIEDAAGATISFVYSRQSSVLRFEAVTITAGTADLLVADPLIVPVIDSLPYVDPTFVPSGNSITVPVGEPTEISGLIIAGHLDGVLTDQSELKIALLFGDLQPL